MKILHRAQPGSFLCPGELIPQSHTEAQAVCLLAAEFLSNTAYWADGDIPTELLDSAAEYRRLATSDEPTLRHTLLHAYTEGPLSRTGNCGEEIWGLLTWAGHPDFQEA